MPGVDKVGQQSCHLLAAAGIELRMISTWHPVATGVFTIDEVFHLNLNWEDRDHLMLIVHRMSHLPVWHPVEDPSSNDHKCPQ